MLWAFLALLHKTNPSRYRHRNLRKVFYATFRNKLQITDIKTLNTNDIQLLINYFHKIVRALIFLY